MPSPARKDTAEHRESQAFSRRPAASARAAYPLPSGGACSQKAPTVRGRPNTSLGGNALHSKPFAFHTNGATPWILPPRTTTIPGQADAAGGQQNQGNLTTSVSGNHAAGAVSRSRGHHGQGSTEARTRHQSHPRYPQGNDLTSEMTRIARDWHDRLCSIPVPPTSHWPS